MSPRPRPVAETQSQQRHKGGVSAPTRGFGEVVGTVVSRADRNVGGTP
ncbi:hypothetical protein ACI3KT_07175 [Microbacterium sp. ZW T6_19]